MLLSSRLAEMEVPSISRTKPTLETWNWIYERDKDKWTTPIISNVAAKAFAEMTEGKTDFDVFVPMCGRSPDVLWLAEQGHRVTGIEWSERAVKRLLQDGNLDYNREACCAGIPKDVSVYRALKAPITIYCGDFFSFRDSTVAKLNMMFDCIWDHGSVGSIPREKSQLTDYVDICYSFLKPKGKILLSAFDYEHREHPAIPFACTEQEIQVMYSNRFDIQRVHKLNKEKSMETPLFEHSAGENFPIWNLTRFSWNFYILTSKHGIAGTE